MEEDFRAVGIVVVVNYEVPGGSSRETRRGLFERFFETEGRRMGCWPGQKQSSSAFGYLDVIFD